MICFGHPFRYSVSCVLVLAVCICAFAQEARPYVIAPFAPELLLYRGVGMVALRPIAELLDASIAPKGKAVVVSRDGKTFACTPGNPVVWVNGIKRTLPVAPFACKGVVYGPLLDCLDALGGQLALDEKAQQASVTCPWLARPLALLVVRTTGDTSLFRDNGLQLFVMDVGGAHLKQLTYNTRGMTYGVPFVSRDGARMVCPRGARLYQRDTDHPALTEIYKQSEGATFDTAYAWFTPNDQHVLFSAMRDGSRPGEIIMLKADGSEKRALGPGNSPWISEDGKRIAFVATTGDGKSMITLMDADGNNRQEIGEGEDPVIFPSGNILAYNRKVPGEGLLNNAVIVLRHTNADGVCTEYAPTPEAGAIGEFFSDYSPDGTQVAFLRGTKLGGWRSLLFIGQGIYLMQADHTNVRQLTNNENDGGAAFIDGGARLLFLRGPRFYTVSANGGEPTPLNLPKTMYVQGYMMTPDEKRIIFSAVP